MVARSLVAAVVPEEQERPRAVAAAAKARLEGASSRVTFDVT